MMPLFYLSFADASLPKGSQFLGAAIVNALSFIEAVTVTHYLGINPGGEVQGYRVVNPHTGEYLAVPAQFIGKLLQRNEIDALSEWAVHQEASRV